MILQAPKRVLLVDDHATFRQALARLLEEEPDLEVVAQDGTLAEARDGLSSEAWNADVAIVDLYLPDGDGTEVIGELREVNPELRVLMLTISLDPADHVRAREAGADEVLDKHTPYIDNLLDTVKRLASQP